MSGAPFSDINRHPALQLRRVGDWFFLLGTLMLGTCNADQHSTAGSPPVAAAIAAAASVKPEESRMWMTVGERRFAITLSDNETARAFAALLPLTVDMIELNGNEKHASLPKALPVDPSRPGQIRNGDLMLYGTDTLVVFYVTFQSPYSYTGLGRVDDPGQLAPSLGRGRVKVVFAKE